tara:strand:+ start:89 stop:244 length:156 start_codon:yes stop_codon:yes gene_type:complete
MTHGVPFTGLASTERNPNWVLHPTLPHHIAPRNPKSEIVFNFIFESFKVLG